MSLEYIVQRPGSPADRVIDEKIAEVMKDPLAQICVITPARSTFQTQERLVHASGRGGHLGLQVVSPAKLAHEVVSGSYGAALETLPEFEKAALVRRIIRSNAEKLPAFGQYETVDFAALVMDTMDRLRAQGVGASDVRKYADEAKSAHAADLAVVWEEYEKERAGRMDDWERMETAIQHLEDSHLFDDTALVVVHGFSAYSEQEQQLLRAVMRAAPRVLLSVYGSEDPAESELFADTEKEGMGLAAWAEKAGIPVEKLEAPSEENVPADIAHAAKHVFSPYTAGKWTEPVPSIRIHRAASKEEEIRAVAEEIARLHLQEGVRFDQFAVVYGNDNEYGDIAERVFTETKIPHFASRLVDPAGTGIGAAMLAAADLVYGPATIDDLMVYYAGIAGNAGKMATRRSQLERAAADGDLLTDILAKEDLPDNVQKWVKTAGEEIKKEFGDLWTEFRSKDQADGGELFRALSKHLKRKWKFIRSQVEKDTEDQELFSSIEMNWVQGFSVLDRLGEQLKGLPIHYGEAREILASALHASQFVTVPQGADEVQVGRLGAIEIPHVHTLFLVGMNDEVLPRFAESSRGVLTTAEYSSIVEAAEKHRPRTKEAQQKFEVVNAMRRAGTQLWCSYDTSGGLKPSVVIERLLNNLFQGVLQEETVAQADFKLLGNACNAALHNMNDTGELPEILQEPEFADRLTMAKAAHQGIVQPSQVPDGAPVPTSASALQVYSECPYKYYLRKGLHAEEPQDSKYNLNAGLYMHDVMQLLGEKIQKCAGKVKWSDISDEDFERFLEESIQEGATLKQHAEAYADTTADLPIVQERLRRGARAIREVRQDGLFVPSEFEVEFASEDGMYSGRIDRIDVAQYGDETYYYIIDYKTSKTGYTRASLAAGTHAVQLIFYSMALQDLMRAGTLPPGKLAGAGFIRTLLLKIDPSKDETSSIGIADGFISVETVAPHLFGTTEGGKNLSGVAACELTKAGKIHGRDANNRGLPQDGEMKKASVTLRTAEEYVREMLRDAGRRIKSGELRIRPLYQAPHAEDQLLKKLTDEGTKPPVCKCCGYSAVCRFDPAQAGAELRAMPSSGIQGGKILEEWGAQREDDADAEQ